ncbi:hypothetical protein ACLBOM_20275 [Escherichia coli]
MQMTALGLGDIAAFPFVEAPDKRNIQDGVRLLKNWARSPRMNRPAPISYAARSPALAVACRSTSGAYGAGSAKNMAACVRR